MLIQVGEPHPLTGRKAPLTLGHEFNGEVVEVGPGVTNVKIGDRVACDVCWGCGECYYCKRNMYNICEKLGCPGFMADGGFAEYVNVPDYSLYKLPDNVPSDAGALVEPMAVGIHAIRLAPVIQGDTVVVVGAGTIGLVTIQAVRAAGASKIFIIETAAARKKLAEKMGATAVFDPKEVDVVAKVREESGGLGADISIECGGNETTQLLAIEVIRRGGKAVVLGVAEKETSLNFNNIVFTQKQIIGSMTYNGDFATAIELLRDGRLKAEPLITGRIKIDDIVEKGFNTYKP